ncbi:CHAT domain-containing protein [Streptomyces sp. NPDC056468]|uniref:CHAT domain-containing protein n=1 Tax=Streptomyces sp. NPDC056468 TaxID=3345830 RepID=UPI003683BC48
MQDRSPAELIAGLRRRIDAYEGGAGAPAVLGPQALDDAHAVLGLLDGPEVEPATAEVLAWFFWYRQRESSDPEDAQQAAWAAVRLFVLIHEGIPDAATPPELDRMLAVHDAALALDPVQARELVDWAVAAPQPEPLYGALEVLEAAQDIAARTPGAPDEPDFQFLYGYLLRTKFEREGVREDLLDALTALRAATSRPPPDAERRGVWFANLGHALMLAYQHAYEDSLAAAVSALRTALTDLAPDSRERLICLQNLGSALLLGNEWNDAAAVLGEAESAAPDGSVTQAEIRSNLGQALFTRYEEYGSHGDLTAALQALQAAHGAELPEPYGARVRAASAPMVGFALLARACSLGSATEAAAELDAAEEAVAHALREAAADGDGPSGASDLGSGPAHAPDLSGGPAQATDPDMRGRAPTPNRQIAQLLHVRARIRYERHRITGDGAGLDGAVQDSEHALRSAALSPAHRAVAQHVLGSALRDRFVLGGVLRDIDRAVALARECLTIDEGTEPSPTARLHLLADALVRRGQSTGARTDLDEAVALCTQGSAAAPDTGLPELLAVQGSALHSRALVAGDPIDLDAAIAVYRRAIDSAYGLAAGPDDTDRARAEPDLNPARSGLCLALEHRFERFGARSDIDEAVALAEATVQDARTNDRCVALNLHTIALRNRYVRYRDPADLDSAVEAGIAAVEATPAAHYQRPAHLSNLGLTLFERFEATQDMADIDAAVDTLRAAVDALPHNHAHRPGLLTNWALALAQRHERTARWQDAEEAIEAVGKALGSVAEDHPDRAAQQYLLAGLLRARAASRWSAERAAEDLTAADEALRAAAATPGVAASVRMAALRLGAEAQTDPAAALERYEQAVSCVQLIAWHGLSRRDREDHLSAIDSLTQDAAAAALDAGRPQRAVELLEHGRSVLWNHALDTGADLWELRAAAPQLAERVETLRTQLRLLDVPDAVVQRPGDAFTSRTPGPRADRGIALGHEWDALIAAIRKDVPGFADFMRPPGFEGLRAAAAEGTVVLLNVSKRRSDALLLTSDDLRVVPLPQLSPGLAEQQMAWYLSALLYYDEPEMTREKHTVLEESMALTLSWLWHSVAEPVLDALSHAGSPPGDGRWPRIWWCPTGSLAFLPLHAAGLHLPAPVTDACVLDRVVSSYTPTLRALIRSRAQAPARGERRRMLMVAMPETPGRRSLPNAAYDTEQISESFAGRCTVRSGAAATRETVLADLATHAWAHFSCHGDQERGDPSRSGLYLHDGCLTVADIAQLRLEQAEFAMLASCMTAVSGFMLPDEAIHPAAALQVAGYRHVLATMWSVNDRIAGEIVDSVYEALVSEGELAAEDCATALHHAVRELRAKPRMPLVGWTPFIHHGP